MSFINVFLSNIVAKTYRFVFAIYKDTAKTNCE